MSSYGSVDASKAGAELKKADVEQGDEASFVSTNAPSDDAGSFGSFAISFEELADSLEGSGGVVFDNDEWVDFDAQGEKTSLKQTGSEAQQPASSKRAGVINLINNVVGTGILTMPAAVQAASFVTSVAMMVVTGLVSVSSFLLIGYLCHKLQCSTYRQLWSKAFGTRSGILVDLSLLVNSLLGCLAFMIMMCDLIHKSYPGLFHTANVPPRALVIWLCTMAVILPLCHLKNLAALKYTSIVAICAFVYVWVLVQFQFWQMKPGTMRLSDNMFKMDSGMLFAVSIFNSAYKAHYNAPTYFKELGSWSAFSRVTWLAYGTILVLYILFCLATFAMFGNDTEGNVLKNFPQGSTTVLLAWLAMAVVTMFSYPLVFKTGRDSMFTLIPALARAEESYPWLSHSAVVTSLVMMVSFGACVLPDVSLVLGLAGATVGAALCWTIPAAIYMKCTFCPTASAEDQTPLPRSYPLLIYAFTLFKVSIGCMVGGVIVVLKR